MSVPRKYGLLRAIAIVLKVLAVIALVLGLVGMVLSLMNGGAGGVNGLFADFGLPIWLTAAGAIAAPLIGLIWFVQLFAFGSILSLLIEVEENTRALTLPPQ